MLFRSDDNRRFENTNQTDGDATKYWNDRYQAEKKNDHVMSPVVILNWLDAFVGTLGLEEVQRLLEHVGKPYEAAYPDRQALV